MIIDLTLQTGKAPTSPLGEIREYVNASSVFFLRGVPQAVGKWRITAVQVTAAHPDNSIASAECVQTGACWTGTIHGSTLPGRSAKGFTISASGIDENGETVTGYVLAIGDLAIIDRDGSITPGQTTYYAHLLDSIPATPKKGDLANFDGVYKLYNGEAWISLGADIAREYAEAALAAKTAAETAQGKAELAETGAVNAKVAALAAKTAAETAQGKAEAAQGSAEAAQADAADSKRIAGQAETSAVNAAVRAEQGALDAVAAKVDAVAAKGSAEAASAAATLAKTAAETAQGKAELAETGAVAAKGSAEAASAAAILAKGSAEAAQAAAEAARDRAEAAANYVVNWDPELNVPYIYVPAE